MAGHAKFLQKAPASASRGARMRETAPHARVDARRSASPSSTAAPAAAGGAGVVHTLQRLAGNQAVMRMLDVQRAASDLREPSDETIRAAAAEGVRTPSTPLPYLDRIQASFGRHSIGDIQAHVGSAATRASRAMNAQAYATGNHVVFGAKPDLHTAAHEAAHVVQQRAGVHLSGGIGRVGDPYERHADAVADAVVAGRSAAEILARNTESGHLQSRDQRKTYNSRPPTEQVALSITSPGTQSIQRRIGKEADGKFVVSKKTHRIYTAKCRPDGRYELLRPNGQKTGIIVRAGDDGFDLVTTSIDEIRSRQTRDKSKTFTITSDQAARRVFAEAPDGAELEERAWFRKKARLESRRGDDTTGTNKGQDYAYADLSEALANLSQQVEAGKVAAEEIDKALAWGAVIPLNDGRVPLHPQLNEDAQLLGFLTRKFQEFHTPPTLVQESRMQENPWRRGELKFTRDVIMQLGFDGMREVLPDLGEGNRHASQLSNMYPGLIDIGIPPDQEQTLFKYNQNKAIYKLNKRMLLRSQLERKYVHKAHGADESDRASRMILNEHFLDEIKNQDDSVITKPDIYLKKTLGLRRSDSAESFDLLGENEKTSEEISGAIYDPADAMEFAWRKKNTFLNTMGLLTKLNNRKILQDRLKIKQFSNGLKSEAAKESLDKHVRIRESLDKKQKFLFERLVTPFDTIDRAMTLYRQKQRKLAIYEPETPNQGNRIGWTEAQRNKWDEYHQELKRYRRTKIGDLVNELQPPMKGVGDETLKKTLGKPRDAEANSLKKNNRSASKAGATPFRLPWEAASTWATNLGGEAMYGSSEGNNCLIYAIASSLDVSLQPAKAAAIRRVLIKSGLPVDETGFLPGYSRVIELIAQLVLAEKLGRDGYVPQIHITLESAAGFNPVIVGQVRTRGGSMSIKYVRIFHDGVHFWYLKRKPRLYLAELWVQDEA